MEENLLRITETWKAYNSDFEESGKTTFNVTFKLCQNKYYIEMTTLSFWKNL